MRLHPEEITIAVTVYDRRRFLAQAIASALNQTVSVRVIVVEDCGPDAMLEEFARSQFGSQIEYYRNKTRRGLFDNWNSCIEQCRTPWLSILHDDDFLDPGFISAMQRLAREAPGRGLYFGETMVVNERGDPVKRMNAPLKAGWRPIGISDFLHTNLIGFPGQLFHVEEAKAVGGFRSGSLFCGDWEMWVKLTARSGGAQIGQIVGFLRQHDDWGRGTNKVSRSGKKQGLIIVQYKRTLAALNASGADARFDRGKLLREHPQSTRFLLGYAAWFPPRLLAYNHRLLIGSTPPHWPYALYQRITRTLGPRFIRATSRIWNQCRATLKMGEVIGKYLHFSSRTL